METQGIVGLGILFIAALMSAIQVSPIKINPWTYLFRAFGRAVNAEMLEKAESLEIQIVEVKSSIAENEAKNARVRILHFGDEIYRGRNYSKEHFINILDDISEYEAYCREHPDFKNERTKETERLILDKYRKNLRRHTFLK